MFLAVIRAGPGRCKGVGMMRGYVNNDNGCNNDGDNNNNNNTLILLITTSITTIMNLLLHKEGKITYPN